MARIGLPFDNTLDDLLRRRTNAPVAPLDNIQALLGQALPQPSVAAPAPAPVAFPAPLAQPAGQAQPLSDVAALLANAAPPQAAPPPAPLTIGQVPVGNVLPPGQFAEYHTEQGPFRTQVDYGNNPPLTFLAHATGDEHAFGNPLGTQPEIPNFENVGVPGAVLYHTEQGPYWSVRTDFPPNFTIHRPGDPHEFGDPSNIRPLLDGQLLPAPGSERGDPGPDPGPGPGPPPPPPPPPPIDTNIPGVDPIDPISPVIEEIPITDFGLSQFDDPGASLLEDLLKLRIDELNQEQVNPAQSQLIEALQAQFGEPNTQLDALLADVQRRIQGLGTPTEFDADVQGRIAALRGPTSFDSDLDQRIAELRDPPFSRGEEELLRTVPLDRISANQDVATRRLLEQIGALGRAPTSGVNAELLRQLSVDFAGQRTQAESEFGVFSAQERQRRLDQAIGLGQTQEQERLRRLDQALSLGQFQEQSVQQRRDQSLGLTGQLNTLQQGRQSNQALLATQLASIEQEIGQREQTRRQESIALASALAEQPERRLQLALATLGVQPPPTSLFNSLAQLVGLGQNQQGIALQAQALQQQSDLASRQSNFDFFGGLGGLLGDVFPQGAQTTTGG